MVHRSTAGFATPRRRLALHALLARAHRDAERRARLWPGIDDHLRRPALRHDHAEALESPAGVLPIAEPVGPAEHLSPLVRRHYAARDYALWVAEHELHVRLPGIDPGERPAGDAPLDLE